MNEESRWNSLAPDYGEEVLNVFTSERNGRLPALINKHMNPEGSAIDFGCGVGNGFPLLCPRFGTILAVDISQKCLGIAKRRGYTNVAFERVDLTRKALRLPHADFGLCVNVAILPEIGKNERIIHNVFESLRPGGTAVFVVPSLDSILFASWQMLHWYRKEKIKAADVPAGELKLLKSSKRDLINGIADVGGVPTKHYSQSELEVLFPEFGFRVESTDRLEYDWSTEFDDPPSWMQAPYPWDWLVECRKDS